MQTQELVQQAGKLLQRMQVLVRTGPPQLVVVMRPFSVQGVIVRNEGGSVRVLRFAQADFESTVRSPKVKMARIMEKLGAQKFSHIILVTPEASCFVVDLPWSSKGRFVSGEKLDGLARWEVASYLEYPAEQALIRALPLADEPDEEEIFSSMPMEDGQDQRKPVLASVFSSRVYSALTRLCGSYKKKLQGVVPEEVFALSARLLAGPHCQCVMVDCRMHDFICVLMDRGIPAGVIRGEVEAGDLYGSSLVRAMEILAPPNQIRVYLTGEMAQECRETLGDDDVDRYSWTVVEEFNGPGGSWGPLPGKYGAALGAALDRNMMTVDDRVPLSRKIRRNVHALPLVLLALLLLGMGAAYGLQRYKTDSLRKRMAGYEKEKKEIQVILDKDTRTRDKYASMTKRQTSLENDKRYLTETVAARSSGLLRFLADVTRCVPREVALSGLTQVSDETWHIRGTSIGVTPILGFQRSLEGLHGVVMVRQESAEAMKKSIPPATHQFDIRVRRGPEDGS
jgi:hypothetical protein